ncbi:flavin reductase family protein [Streptomyces sp. NPDC059680]|uniref:flavin reductase family protein n=1 Tax=Streptomyces sp. NPDC059680 TaxID=3346904 RepID=UPI0036BED9C1
MIPAETTSGVNLITLCFDMHASYKPPMFAFSVHRRSLSHFLIQKTDNCVLAIPGGDLADEVMFCGSVSGGSIDKVSECGFTLVDSECTTVPGISECIGSVELEVASRIPTGDHLTVIGRVLAYRVREDHSERCLLSVGPDEAGYRVLARKGIHRLAVVDA